MLSGRGFAEKCTWVVDPRYPDLRPFQYAAAKHGDWVFVNGDYLPVFLRAIPFIRTKRFVVIVHNTDRAFGERELGDVLPVSHHIFAINTTVRHERLTTIPIGFVDKQLPLLRAYTRPDTERTIEIYANFTKSTNSVKRQQCIDAFPHAVFRSNLSVPEYLDDLSKSKFVLCPEGTGMDTHRVYESILCGATPVVLRNSLSHLYSSMPVCIVNSWTDPFHVPVNKEFSMECSSYLTRK